MMANVIDIAKYILKQSSYISTMKLQKLVYYSQAYHLVTKQKPLFIDRIEAWVNGPVVPALYDYHKNKIMVNYDEVFGENKTINIINEDRDSVNYVISKIGDYSGIELSKLTHSESPWIDARIGCKPNERCNKEITRDAIAVYYSSDDCKNILFN